MSITSAGGSRSYDPGRDPKPLNAKELTGSKSIVLQTASCTNVDGSKEKYKVASTVQRRENTAGPPVFAVEFTERQRTPSVECKERIRKACRSEDIMELRRAFQDAIDPYTDCFLVPARAIKPMLRKVREHHSANIEEALLSRDPNAIAKAIEACEADMKEKPSDMKSRLIKERARSGIKEGGNIFPCAFPADAKLMEMMRKARDTMQKMERRRDREDAVRIEEEKRKIRTDRKPVGRTSGDTGGSEDTTARGGQRRELRKVTTDLSLISGATRNSSSGGSEDTARGGQRRELRKEATRDLGATSEAKAEAIRIIEDLPGPTEAKIDLPSGADTKEEPDADQLGWWATRNPAADVEKQDKQSDEMNSAFVFVKPHAMTDKVKELAKAGLEAKGIKILKEGSIKGEVIDEKKLIDQHYYAIASKATILKPDQLNVPEDKFEGQFGLSWKDALASGKVFNALDGCEKLGIDANQMGAAWSKAKDDKKLIKFGGGFYCGLVEIEDKDPLYIFNGFFMSMRSKFTNPGTEIYYYSVEWDPAALSWADFRGKVLGPTDPAEAPEDSLRGQILANWEELGLVAKPNVGDNGMHASASPFEAFAERNNWMEVPIAEDRFAARLLAENIPLDAIKAWSVDPQVIIEEGGKEGSIFDQLEDLDANACLAKIVDLTKLNNL